MKSSLIKVAGSPLGEAWAKEYPTDAMMKRIPAYITREWAETQLAWYETCPWNKNAFFEALKSAAE